MGVSTTSHDRRVCYIEIVDGVAARGRRAAADTGLSAPTDIGIAVAASVLG